ncbi:MAG: hypothetical protein IKK91_10195 [Ruminococcus sp.]|nr:hypothetical protein [Ruminococcus sp.]
MGFFDGLLSLGAAAGMLKYYKSKYKQYEDEELFDEFVKLWKLSYEGIADEEDIIKKDIIKLILEERELL